MDAIPIIHLCRWSKWTAAMPSFESAMRQARNCVICNRIQMRSITDHQQTGAQKVNTALAERVEVGRDK